MCQLRGREPVLGVIAAIGLSFDAVLGQSRRSSQSGLRCRFSSWVARYGPCALVQPGNAGKNSLSGSSSSQFSNFSKLSKLSIFSNPGLDWDLELFIHWPLLESAVMHECSIRGELPHTTALVHLEELLLAQNLLSGTLNEQFFEGTNESLQTLSLSLTAISGTLPYALENGRGVSALLLNDMRLSGTLPGDTEGHASPLYEGLQTLSLCRVMMTVD